MEQRQMEFEGSSRDKIDTPTDSDTSSDTSRSHKHLKSTLTLLKNTPASMNDRKIASPQDGDTVEHYRRLLQEAELSLSNRDVLIKTLQDQLKKIQDMYKQCLDDTQDIRYKYSMTKHELETLRTLCEKYREDIEMLISEKQKQPYDEIQKLEKKLNETKAHYEQMLKSIGSTESVYPKNESKNVQVEVVQLTDDMDTLKSMCKHMGESLDLLNRKFEVLLDANTMKVGGSPVRHHTSYPIEQTANSQRSVQTQHNQPNNFPMPKAPCGCSLRYPKVLARDTSNGPVQNNPASNSTEKRGITFQNLGDKTEEQIQELQKENANLKAEISRLQQNEALPSQSDQIEKMSLEIVNLKRELEEKGEIQEQLKQERDDAIEQQHQQRSPVIEELQRENALLREDYKNLVDKNGVLEENLKKFEVSMADQAVMTEEYTKDEEHQNILEDNQKLQDCLCCKEQELEELQNIFDIMKTETVHKDTLIKTLENEKSTLYEENRQNQDILKSTIKEMENVNAELRKQLQDVRNQSEEQLENLKEAYDKEKEEDATAAELLEYSSKIQYLQSHITEIRKKLDEAEQENEMFRNQLQEHADCSDKFTEIETDVKNKANLIRDLETENANLQSQVDTVNNVIQQHKDEASFKKLENEKLQQKVKEQNSLIMTFKQNCDCIAREYNKEVEKNKVNVAELSRAYDEYKQEYVDKIDRLNAQIDDLSAAMEQKDEEIKTLKDKINHLMKECEVIRGGTDKTTQDNEQFLEEVLHLYKIKEHEIALALEEIDKEKLRSLELKQELERVKATAETNPVKDDDTFLMVPRTLESTSRGSSSNTSASFEINNFVNNIHRELHHLKAQLDDLLVKLTYKLHMVKRNVESDMCDVRLLDKTAAEMLDYIHEFNTSVLRSPNVKEHLNTYKSEKHTNQGHSKPYKSDPCCDVSQNCCFKAGHWYESNVMKDTEGVHNIGNSETDSYTKLQMKRQYLIEKIMHVYQQMNDIIQLTNESAIKDKPGETKRAVSEARMKNTKVMHQMAADLNEIKEQLLTVGQFAANTLKEESAESGLNLRIRELEEQIQIMNVITGEIEELDKQLKSQYTRLKEVQQKSGSEKSKTSYSIEESSLSYERSNEDSYNSFSTNSAGTAILEDTKELLKRLQPSPHNHPHIP